MSKALIEFKNFISLNSKCLSDQEKKLSYLILDNFSDIESVGSHGGRRSKLLASLIEKNEEIEEIDFVTREINAQRSENPLVRLSTLKVKNFRGFSEETVLDFKNPYTFVYGPNGTGKSSFCEALEFSLLGTIQEADLKRIDLPNYIKNVNTARAEHPILIGIDNNGNEFQIEPNQKQNEFCIIERTRIDGFSRVSATTPQAQQLRLAALFGLADFNNFVNNFNERFDNYIDCNGEKKEQFIIKEKEILIHSEFLEEVSKKREEVEYKVNLLLKTYPSVTSIEVLKENILGNEGVLKKNNKELAELNVLKPMRDAEVSDFLESIKQLEIDVREYKKDSILLEEYKKELSLKELYLAILQNKDKELENCPACESQIYIEGQLVVPVDPFNNAQRKLKEFESAIQLENKVSELNKNIENTSAFLEQSFFKILLLANSINFDKRKSIEALRNQFIASKESGLGLEESIENIVSHTDMLNDLKQQLVDGNLKVKYSENRIRELDEENRLLNTTLEDISDLRAIIKSIDLEEKKSLKAIDEFREKNKELIEQVELEKPLIERNRKYNNAYNSLKSRLEEHNRLLPVTLAANLNAKVLEFYNLINRYDHPTDLLEELRLPGKVGDKIEIRRKGGKDLDALHVLSEGHIRCLGLAILLAKNVQENLPIIIFDDAVNAIDDEHRRGVLETILEHQDIKEKQLIITTHGEEFIKQLENHIPFKEHSNKVNRIDFLESNGTKNISIKLNLSRNYLIVAQKRLEEGQVRDSLANCRRAFENTSNALWKRLAKKYNVQLSVSMRSPGKSPELMSTAQALCNYMQKNRIETYSAVVPLLENLIGKRKKNLVEWNYLNKGTRDEEREEEFDKIIVREILNTLEEANTIVMKN